jgi:hypothetical protein
MRSSPHRGHSLFLIAPALALAIAWSALGRADTPPGRFTLQSGTVYDTNTKLTWQQAATPGAATWANAKSYCANLTLNGVGWRMPSMKELQTIVDETRTNPAIDPKAFPDTPAAFFWTSSPLAGDPSLAWLVDFGVGNAGTYLLTGANQMRCVR